VNSIPLVGDAVAGGTDYSTLMVFVAYTFAVLFLGWLAAKMRQSKSFMNEYFLGGRSLGFFAFALTFAATAISGGTFLGFPAFVYTYGWITGLWIAGYMVVPLLAIGLLGKRINQMARRSGAITMPDLIAARLQSRGAALLGTYLILFFVGFNLVAQFKAGALVLETMLQDAPLMQSASRSLGEASWFQSLLPNVSGSYAICLIAFAVSVIAYTSHGGFHAVVWTDILQALVMALGVALLIPLTISAAGGFDRAAEVLQTMAPPREVDLVLRVNRAGLDSRGALPAFTWIASPDGKQLKTKTRAVQANGELRVRAYEYQANALAGAKMNLMAGVEVLSSTPVIDSPPRAGDRLRGPGYRGDDAAGFLPLQMAISMFLMWTLSTTGQPSNMLRLMAVKDTKSIRVGLATVTVYFGLIYFGLVIIFAISPVVLPGLEGDPDRVMPELSRHVTRAAAMPWLGGVILAAPFSAIMSTVSGFLLMISSAFVRDLYQGSINPHVSEANAKWLAFFATAMVGVIATALALYPPQFLQTLIIFTGTGISSCFLFPVMLMLYWPRFNRAGFIGGMLGGFLTHTALYLAGMVLNGSLDKPIRPLGFDPSIGSMAVSLLASFVMTWFAPAPPVELVRRFFMVRKD
jgi:sodium/pantothenate symporter